MRVGLDSSFSGSLKLLLDVWYVCGVVPEGLKNVEVGVSVWSPGGFAVWRRLSMLCLVESQVGCVEMLLVLLNLLDVLDRDCVELILEQLDAEEGERVWTRENDLQHLHDILHLAREGALGVEQTLLFGFLGGLLLPQGCLFGGLFGGAFIALLGIYVLEQHVQDFS